MLATILIIIAVLAYFVVAGILIQQLRSGQQRPVGLHPVMHSLGTLGLIAHGYVLYNILVQDDGLNLALMNAVNLVAWVITILFLISAFRKPINNLGILVMPLTALLLIGQWLWPGPPLLLSEFSAKESVHIIISLLAYSLLAIAAGQSVLLMVQENQIKHKHPGGFIRALPPMETMESLMFQMILVGFILLTLTLVSGVFFSEEVFGKPLQFNHHIVLSIISWLIFALLLFGRWRFGWRGKAAAIWTLSGFAILMLAYFGTKFVLEILKNPN